MVKKVTVFTRATCAPCKMLKAYLNHKGMAFDEINVDENPDARAQAYELAGYSIVPLTVIELVDGSKKVVTGYNLQVLSSLIK